MRLFTNGGYHQFTKVDCLKIFPIQLHLNKESMTSIISFDLLVAIPDVHITIDTGIDKVFSVHYKGIFFSLKDMLRICITMIRLQIILLFTPILPHH